MLRFLDRLSLEARFFLALGLPLVAIIWMTTSGALDRHKEASNLREVETLSRLAVQVGSLVHQLQVERGMSHGYLGSRGSTFFDALPVARAATDRELHQLLDHLDQYDLAFLERYQEQTPVQWAPSPVSNSETPASGPEEIDVFHSMLDLGVIIRELEDLSEVRQQLDDFTISAQKARDYYTRVNLQLHSLIARLAQHPRQVAINRQLTAYHTLMMYKELAGLERATVTLVLSSGVFTADQRRDLLQLSGEQRGFYTTFLRLVDTRHGEQLQGMLRRHDHPERANFRQTLLDHAAQAEPPLDDLSAGLPLLRVESWFALQTSYIDQIKAVEDSLAAAIISQAIAQREAANGSLLRYLIISPLSVLAALLLVYLIIRSTHLRLVLADTIFNHTHDGITITDHNANIIDTNRAFTRITGYARDEVEGKNPRILQSGRQGPLFYRKMWQELATNGTWHGEIWNRCKSGELYAELLTISAVHDKSGKAKNYIAIFSDITDRANEHQRQLERRASYDSMTGLPNSTLLVDRLRHALRNADRDQHAVAVAVINLDDLKLLNERHGYAAGDRVIEIMAKRFQKLLRDGDTLARLGGNEFAVIIEGVASPHEATAILERLHQQAAKPIVIQDTTVNASASIGTTYFPLDSGEAETLLRHAHQALLQAKLNGRNRIQHFDLRDAELQSSLSRLVQRLEVALVNNELVLHYQPKVDLVTGELIGAEALLRWQDPERGMVLPGEFLPYLEQHLIAVTIGNWVVETALAQMEHWQREGASIRVSVNVSAQELHHPGFVENLRSHLAARPELANDMLELEILESAAIGDIKRASQVLSECRSMGVSIALDDFGTGYASLDYLKFMPASSLKIDQTFVRDMLADSGDRMIVKAIVSLADAFGFEVTAEGVENEAQGLALIELGCRQGQGFGIGRPMPADALLSWYRDWRTFPSWKKQSMRSA